MNPSQAEESGKELEVASGAVACGTIENTSLSTTRLREHQNYWDFACCKETSKFMGKSVQVYTVATS